MLELRLSPCPKGHLVGLDKAIPPEKTITHAKSRLTSQPLALLQETRRIDRGRLDIPVYISTCGPDAARLTGGGRQMGKGATPAQSEASALMELVERISLFHFLKHSAFPVETWSARGADAVPLSVLCQALHDDPGEVARVAPLLAELPLTWVRALDVARDEPVWLPFHYFYRIFEFSGSAAGNTAEEALLQALCEVVERHVSSVLVHERRRTPRILPESVQDPVSRGLLARFAQAGVRLELRDFTLDMGIPSVGALAWDPAREGTSEIVFAAGTAPSPAQALIRAVTEVAQMAGDFLERTYYRPTLPRFERLEEADYVTQVTGETALDSLPDLQADDIREEVRAVAAALQTRGLPAYGLDLTHAQLQVPAVYAVVSGAHLQERARADSLLFHVSKLASLIEVPETAVAHTGRLRMAFPDRFEPAFFHGYALARQGAVEAAIAELRRSLECSPRPQYIALTWGHIGECLRRQGDYRGAVEAVEQGLCHDSSQKELFQVLGYSHFLRRDFVSALNAFREAIRLDPNSAIDHANVGSSLRELGHGSEAVRWYRMALERDPSLEGARVWLERLSGVETG